MSKSDYLENALLDHVLGDVAYAPPATVYVGLFTAPVAEGGSPGSEVSGGGYLRVAVPNDLANWPLAANGRKSNALDLTFPAPTADWGTVVAFALLDSAVGTADVLWSGNLIPSQVIAGGDNAPVFLAGSLVITED